MQVKTIRPKLIWLSVFLCPNELSFSEFNGMI